MLNRFAALWRAPLFGAFLVVSLASCSTLTTKVPSQPRHRFLDGGAAERVDAWFALRERLRSEPQLSELQKLDLVNNFFNTLSWRSDLENWGVEDYWATPLETLIRGAGDCEDFAIGKYFTLLEAGVDEERLRLSYVWRWHEGEREAHLVLAYYAEEGSRPLILDNLVADALVLEERQDLEKVYSFNRWNLWLAEDAQRALSVASQDRLDQWRQVNERMLLEVEERLVAR